jgi:Replication initiation factor
MPILNAILIERPPIVIRGCSTLREAENMRTHGKIDWLAVTYQNVPNPTRLLAPIMQGHSFTVKGPGPHGYLKMWTNDLGATLLTDGAPNMGIHAIMTGQTLESVRAFGATDRTLAGDIVAMNGRVSRVDVAVDVFETTLTPEDLETAYRALRVMTRARAGSVIRDLETPEHTVYIGKRASGRLLRAYNKGAQMRTDEAWLRLELECKKVMARNLIATIAEHDDTRAVINNAIRKFVNFPDIPEYVAALDAPNVMIRQQPAKMTRTYLWLLSVCAPALARYETEHPSDNVFDAFFTAYGIALNRLKTDHMQASMDRPSTNPEQHPTLDKA